MVQESPDTIFMRGSSDNERTYRAPQIMAFAIERGSILRPIVQQFLAGERDLSSTELMALHAYICRFIDWKKKSLARLADEAPNLKTREDFVHWFAEARLHDFDPVE
jgi:hypothetical protein